MRTTAIAWVAWIAWAAAVASIAGGCGSETQPVAKTPRTLSPEPVAAVQDKSTDCRVAQRAEVEAWIAEMVTDQSDELEMWTALGMIMTLTEPAVLGEMRETMPEASDAIGKSGEAWKACQGVVTVNCVALDRALDVTEERVGETVWDRADVATRCMGGQVNADQADCALAASDAATARECFPAGPLTRR